MNITPEFIKFVKDHIDDDVSKLRLKSFDNVGFDIPFAIDQIESRRKTRYKLKSLNALDNFLYPSVISAEQATSDVVAAYKSSIFSGKCATICDLTGGLGVDTAFLSDIADNVTYIERYKKYCETAKHNFAVLNKKNIEVINADCLDFINNTTKRYDLFYIDPARRDCNNKRLFAFSECEPNLPAMMPRLLALSDNIAVKASPMADISMSVKELGIVSAVYVISVKNECKELLFVLSNHNKLSYPLITCVDIANLDITKFAFSMQEEESIESVEESTPLSYLYEPLSVILKGGAFKSVAKRYGVYKIHKSSHLYTSDNYIDSFPGRKFRIKEVIPFKNNIVKHLNKKYPFANIAVRNFPIKADEVKQRLKIKDGGDTYIFATKCYSGDNMLIICDKADIV